MTINFHIPPSVEQAIARAGRDPAEGFKEAGLVELYRQNIISHGELAEGLGISRPEVDAVLQRHKVTEDLLTSEELAGQVSRLRKLAG